MKKIVKKNLDKTLRNNSVVGIILNLSLVYARMLVTNK